MSHHLSLLLLTPIGGAIALWLWGSRSALVTRRLAQIFATATLVVAAPLWFTYDREGDTFQFVEIVHALPGMGVDYHLGVDGLGLLLVLMTSLMVCVTVVWSTGWREPQDRVPYAWVLALEFGVLLTFLSLDLLVLLAGWTITLVAVHYVCEPWRAEGRRGSVSLLSTGLSSVSVLGLCVAIAWLASAYHRMTGQYSFDITTYQRLQFDASTQRWVFLSLAVAFAACVALALPRGGVFSNDRAPSTTVGLVLVGAVVVKLGTYGLLRLSLPILPDATRSLLPFTAGASGLVMFAAGVLALARRDEATSIVYASLSQLAMMVLGAVVGNPVSVTGSALHQVSHGISFGGLWLVAAAAQRRHRDGESSVPPMFRAAALVILLGAIGLPMLSGFVGSFLVLQGVATVNAIGAVAVACALVFGGVALMRTARGVLDEPGEASARGQSRDHRVWGAEWLTVAPLVALTVGAGVYPTPWLERLTTGVDRVVARVAPEYGEHAIAECGAPPTPELAKTNAAAAFLQSVPCGPDGKPLDQPAVIGQSPSR